jgi:hypothetical protein
VDLHGRSSRRIHNQITTGDVPGSRKATAEIAM